MQRKRRNSESGLAQVSVWLRESDVEAFREIGKRPEVDREWSWLVRKAMQEFIERDKAQQREKTGGAS
jgi:hypothetical protein